MFPSAQMTPVCSNNFLSVVVVFASSWYWCPTHLMSLTVLILQGVNLLVLNIGSNTSVTPTVSYSHCHRQTEVYKALSGLVITGSHGDTSASDTAVSSLIKGVEGADKQISSCFKYSNQSVQLQLNSNPSFNNFVHIP